MTAITPQEATEQLFEASMKGDMVTATAALAAGSDVNAKDHDHSQQTPLHYAAIYDNIDIVRLLIDRGAEINVRDGYQRTPLHWAVDKGHTDIARLLIDNEAEINATDKYQRTQLHYAVGCGHTELAHFIIESGAEINAQDYHQQTPLHWAANHGNTELVELLLSKGADPTLPDNNGATARQLSGSSIERKPTSDLLATAEAWHSHMKILLGPDGKLNARRLVDADGTPTEALKNLLPIDQFAALAKPGLYRKGMEGLVKIYPHLPPAVQATIDLTDWRLSKLKELETEPSAVERYVRHRPSPSEKKQGNDDQQAGRS